MRTRGLTAVGAAAVAMMSIAGTARAQQTGDERAGRGPNLPPADQPLVRRIPQPRLTVEGGAGILGFTGGGASVGPMWNARVTGTLSPRWAVEANYVGAANRVPREDETLVMTSLNADLRYSLLRPEQAPVVPFVAAGVGYAGWSGRNGDPFALTIPLSAGAERMLTRNIKVGARVNFTPAFFDDLGNAGGDTWSLLAHLGGGF